MLSIFIIFTQLGIEYSGNGCFPNCCRKSTAIIHFLLMGWFDTLQTLYCMLKLLTYVRMCVLFET